jgi:hypothetical protein
VMREVFKPWKMRRVIISKNKFVLVILKMIPIAETYNVAGFNNNGFTDLKYVLILEPNSNAEVRTIACQDFLLV